RLGRYQRRLGVFRFQVMDDGGGIGEAIIAVLQRWHLAERARRAEVWLGVREASRLQLEFDTFLSGKGHDLADERRQSGTVKDHRNPPCWCTPDIWRRSTVNGPAPSRRQSMRENSG